MAIEKILQTRIQLRYDEYTNWYNNNPVLKRGEIAIATIPENHTNPSTGEITQIPAVVMKVGTGAETGSNYRDLPFVSAKAADVLAACKSEASLRTFVNGVIADAGIATSEAMEALAGRVTKLEGDENTAGSVAKAIKDAINALNLTDTYATKDHDHEIFDVNGLQDALDGKQASGDYATKSEAQGYANAKDNAIAEAKKAGDDAAAALNTYKGEMVTALAGKQDVIAENTYDAYGSAAQALEDAKKYADDNDADTQYGIEYDSVNKKIKLVSDTSKTEIDATDFIKDGMIESVALSDDGLNLVITWNTDADKGENNMTTIPLTGLVDVYTGVDGTTVTVSVSSDDKISAEVKTGSIKDGHIASDAAIAKGKLAADVQTSLGLADSAIQEADLGTMAKETADDYVKKADAVGYADILTKTEAQGAYQAKGEYYTKSEADAAFTNSTEVDGQIDAKITALDLANTYQAKGNYATAEQGGKADTAIQSVTSVAGNGIKATTNGTSVTIDWDSEVVLVFDCGDSGVTA